VAIDESGALAEAGKDMKIKYVIKLILRKVDIWN
jgi:hypothetical protein